MSRTHIAAITEKLDQIATEIEPENPIIALAIDRISDRLTTAAASIDYDKILKPMGFKKHSMLKDKDFQPAKSITNLQQYTYKGYAILVGLMEEKSFGDEKPSLHVYFYVKKPTNVNDPYDLDIGDHYHKPSETYDLDSNHAWSEKMNIDERIENCAETIKRDIDDHSDIKPKYNEDTEKNTEDTEEEYYRKSELFLNKGKDYLEYHLPFLKKCDLDEGSFEFGIARTPKVSGGGSQISIAGKSLIYIKPKKKLSDSDIKKLESYKYTDFIDKEKGMIYMNYGKRGL